MGKTARSAAPVKRGIRDRAVRLVRRETRALQGSRVAAVQRALRVCAERKATRARKESEATRGPGAKTATTGLAPGTVAVRFRTLKGWTASKELLVRPVKLGRLA